MKDEQIQFVADALARGLQDPTATSRIWQQVRRLGRDAYAQGLSAHDMEEIAWEAVEKAMKDLPKWRAEGGSESNWLLSCAAARVPTLVRSRRVSRERMEKVFEELVGRYKVAVVGVEELSVSDLMLRVAEVDRVALELWADGWSHADIARHLGISEVTSRQRVWRARQAIAGGGQ